MENIIRDEVVRKWSESGLLNGITPMSDKKSFAQLFESQASHLLSEKTVEISIGDTISYFENRVAGARRPEHKIRPMQHLIKIMICNIIKKHCS